MFSVIMIRLKTREEIEKESDQNYEARLVRSDVDGLSRAERRARARAIMKQQRRVQPERRNDQHAQGGEEDARQVVAVPAVEPEDVDDDLAPAGGQMSRKERLKRAKATEKEERKLMQEQRQKHQQTVELTAQQERRDRESRLMVELESERQQQRRVREEAEQKLLSEQKTFLSTHSSSLTVEEWISELQVMRSMSIDDMARRFQVPSELVVGRIKELIKQQRVTGIITDSGLFVYISEDDLEQIVERLALRNSTELADVSAICNSVMFDKEY